MLKSSFNWFEIINQYWMKDSNYEAMRYCLWPFPISFLNIRIFYAPYLYILTYNFIILKLWSANLLMFLERLHVTIVYNIGCLCRINSTTLMIILILLR